MKRSNGVACELVRRTLNAVVGSETFSRSERLRSFLSYIVECELSGKAAQLKGYSIGIDVFGRPSGFDAGGDPLVRVQAGKLRKLLEQYYETEGAADPLRIRVPLGSYVPEYTLAEDLPVPASEAPAIAQPALPLPLPLSLAVRQTPAPHRSWLPAPISSPIALLSLLPLIFLAPSAYPETATAMMAKAQLVLSVQNKLAGRVQALPQLRILQCWPASGQCAALARAISKSAEYHRTVHLVDSREAGEVHPLTYSIRIENRADGRGVYARLIHQQSGATIYARYFARQQLHNDSGIAYEAVVFAARALSANGPLYRHAMQTGTASGVMGCLAQAEHDPFHDTLQAAQSPRCDLTSPVPVGEIAVSAETPSTLTR